MPERWKMSYACKNGMEDMQYLFVNYNYIAFLETKLRFVCKRRMIMTIMKKNTSLPPMCIQSRATGFTPTARFVF